MHDHLLSWKELAAQLRVDSIRCSTAAGSGHPTSSLSAADLMAVLIARYLKYDWKAPEYPNNDRLIFSKGHASPLLYAIYKAVGAITDEELLSYRKFGSRLQGHPNPRVLPWVEAATGSLGQGLAIGVGMALNGKYLDELPYRTWVLLGDGEMAEGSVWEAFDKASHYGLNRLVALIDMNRLGQRGETELGWNSGAYADRVRAFGWNSVEIDGHDLAAIDQALGEALAQQDRPTCVIAKTIKGRGVESVENVNGWHGKALPEEQAQAAIAELGGARRVTLSTELPERQDPARPAPISRSRCPSTSGARRKRLARPMAMHWPPWAPASATWSCSTARFRIRRTRGNLNRRFRIASSKCSSPSSRCWGPRSDWVCSAKRHLLPLLRPF